MLQDAEIAFYGAACLGLVKVVKVFGDYAVIADTDRIVVTNLDSHVKFCCH